MAKAKAKNHLNLKGIPPKHHRAVRANLALALMENRAMSAQEAYADLQVQLKEEAERKAREEQQKAAERKEDRECYAKKDVAEAIRKLAYLRDFLRPLGGDHSAVDHVEAAVLSHALLVEAGSELEQALFNLGIVEGMSSAIKGRREGWIKEFLS